MNIALSVLRDQHLLNNLLSSMNNDDYHHLLDEPEQHDDEENTGFNKMNENMMNRVPTLLEKNPDVLKTTSENTKLKSMLVSKLLESDGDTLTQLLIKQLGTYNEGRTSNVTTSYEEKLKFTNEDAFNAAKEVSLQIQQSIIKVPHSSDWKASFRKQLAYLLKQLDNGGSLTDEKKSNGNALNDVVDDFAGGLEKSLSNVLRGSSKATDDAHTREALQTFGRHLVGRLNDMDKRLLGK